jgi:hypothetical protein
LVLRRVPGLAAAGEVVTDVDLDLSVGPGLDSVDFLDLDAGSAVGAGRWR